MVGIEDWSSEVTEIRVLLAPWQVLCWASQPPERGRNGEEAEKRIGGERKET